jgi:flagellar FliL protein
MKVFSRMFPAVLVVPGFLAGVLLGRTVDLPWPPGGAAPAAGGAPSGSVMYSLKERVFNLADPGGGRYIKLEVVIEFDDPTAAGLKGEAYLKRQEELARELAPVKPRLDDVLLTTVTSRTSAELLRPEGKEALRSELKTKFGQVVHEPKVRDVFFAQFVIQ